MYSKKHRLPKAELDQFRGTKHAGNHLTLITQPSHHQHSRAAVIVNKKVATKAVARNRIKRQIKSAIAPQLTIPPYLDMLVIAKPSITQISYTDIENNINNLIQQAKKQ